MRPKAKCRGVLLVIQMNNNSAYFLLESQNVRLSNITRTGSFIKLKNVDFHGFKGHIVF
jgi:hypothetical protein